MEHEDVVTKFQLYEGKNIELTAGPTSSSVDKGVRSERTVRVYRKNYGKIIILQSYWTMRILGREIGCYIVECCLTVYKVVTGLNNDEEIMKFSPSIQL
jgi:hypothetical protein